MAEAAGSRAVIAALAANLGIAVTKFIAFLLTASSSMLAESVHSVADSGNQVLLLVGRSRSRRPASPVHPFGFGRVRYLYSFLVAIVLFVLGGLFALYEAYEKWVDPEPIEGRWAWVPLAVVAVALVLEGWSLRTAVREAGVGGRPSNWVRFIRRSKAPELPVVLLEDLGALCGLVLAGLGVTLTLVTGNGRWDAAGGAVIGLLLIVIACVLGWEVSSLLLGEAATPATVTAIEQALVGDGIERVIHMRTVHLGPEELLVAAKVAIPGTDRGVEIAAAIDAAEARVRAVVPTARWMYLEPDVDRRVRT